MAKCRKHMDIRRLALAIMVESSKDLCHMLLGLIIQRNLFSYSHSGCSGFETRSSANICLSIWMRKLCVHLRAGAEETFLPVLNGDYDRHC